MLRSLRAPLGAAAVVSLASFVTAQNPASNPAESLQSLLVHTTDAIEVDFVGDPAITGWQGTYVRTDLIHQSIGDKGGRFSLPLFDGDEHIVRYDRHEFTPQGGVVWTGSIETDRYNNVTIAVHGEKVAATVRYDHQLYRIQPAGETVHVLSKLDENLFPTCGTDDDNIVGPKEGEAVVTNPGAAKGQGSGYTADVLVAYSPQARSAQGGTNAILSLINLAISETNTSYANVNVTTRLRLVHAVELAQNENSSFSTMLNRTQNPNDGWYDEILPLRNQYGADFVATIVNGTQYCGIANLMNPVNLGFAGSAYSVTARTCATGYYSFGHEIGHNMGCHHDRDNAGAAAYNYSYGYRTPNNQWRTVMAYSPGTRINYYSNPDVQFAGFNMGIASGSQAADNSRGIDQAAPTYSQFYCAKPQSYGTGMTTSAGGTLTLSWSGVPRASGTGNFTMNASQGISGKPGLLFYGYAQNSLPFQGGTLYVAPPTVRLPATPFDSFGLASYDLIGLGNFSAGECVFTQYWARDPQNPGGFGIMLSNGVRIDICQ